MELVPLNKEDHEQTELFYKFRRMSHDTRYPQLPAPERELYSLHLNTTERPTHRIEYYLIKFGDMWIGFLWLRYHKITDIDNLGVEFYIDEKYRTPEMIRSVFRMLDPLILDRINVIDVSNTNTSNSENKLGRLTAFGDIEKYLVYTERINVSELSNFDSAEIDLKVNEFDRILKEKGFELLKVKNGEFDKEPKLDYQKYLTAVGQIWNDMPTEDANWDEEVISPEIHGAIFKNVKELGGLHYCIILIENKTGDIAGYTDVYYYPTQPGIVHQGDTGVIATFRGNGFGRLLKYNMLHYILHHEHLSKAKVWVTGNANSNKHMLAINDELGYKHLYSDYYFDIPRDTFRSLIEE